MLHEPVLLKETLDCLNLRQGITVVDGTLGSGGHAVEILKRIGSEGRLIGLDCDPAAISRSRERLKDFQNVSFHRENYKNVDSVLDALNISLVDAVVLDIGISSDQLENPDRGFSFVGEGALDMRMDPSLESCARDLVNDLSQEELADIFWRYGEERNSRKFARAICERRGQKPVQTTRDLADIVVESVLGYSGSSRGGKKPYFKRHPATRIFQALRIAVNQELAVLEEALPRIWKRIREGGRFAVITFHSLEDRIVKNYFKQLSRDNQGIIVAKKPITPTREEEKRNPRSRSAKLRVVEKKS